MKLVAQVIRGAQIPIPTPIPIPIEPPLCYVQCWLLANVDVVVVVEVVRNA